MSDVYYDVGKIYYGESDEEGNNVNYRGSNVSYRESYNDDNIMEYKEDYNKRGLYKEGYNNNKGIHGGEVEKGQLGRYVTFPKCKSISMNMQQCYTANDDSDEKDCSGSIEEKIKKFQKKKFTLKTNAFFNNVMTTQTLPLKSPRTLTIDSCLKTEPKSMKQTKQYKRILKTEQYNISKKKKQYSINIKPYQHEINVLKATIAQLQDENQKLKTALNKERLLSQTYQQLTENIIHNYTNKKDK